MSRGRNAAKSSVTGSEAEVEDLLRAAEDDLLLKLRLDSHPISSAAVAGAAYSSYPDLERRFESLKVRSSPSKPINLPEKKGGSSEAEVEDLLRATEDDLLLKLRVDYRHISSSTAVGSADSHPDLARRFEALKACRPSPSSPTNPPEKKGGDDLAARFAGLKGSLGPDPASGLPFPASDAASCGIGGGYGEGGVSEEEVEKVMQWAMDAARLDTQKGVGEEGEDGSGADDDEDDDEADAAAAAATAACEEEGKKGKGKPKKWLF